MTLDDFRYHFDRLVKAFSVARPDDKATVYFEMLETLPAKEWAAATNYFLRHGQRFPAVADLLEYLRGRAAAKAVVRETCQKCDGFGWVMDGDAYRGMCDHGKRLSQAIKTKDHRAKTTLTDEEIATAVAQKPIQFMRGLVRTGPMMKKQNPEFYGRLRKILLEVVGKERAVEIWNEESKKKEGVGPALQNALT